MINTELVMRSLPLVASILGKKYGVKVEIGGTEAYTNGKNIHLPALPANMPETFQALARGYLDHESAHIRETDFEALKRARLSPLEQHIWNTIEDWRVEKKIAAVFPGCRGNFNWLIKHVFGSEQTPSSTHPAADILNWLLLHIRSWDVPELCANRDCLAAQLDVQYPGMRSEIETILEYVYAACDSTQDAIDYARQITCVLRKSAHQEQTGTSPEEAATGDHNASNKECDKEDPSYHPHDETRHSERSTNEVDNRAPTNSERSSNAVLTESARQELGSLLEAQDADLPSSVGSILSARLEDAAEQNSSQNAIAVAVSTAKRGKALSEDEIRETALASVALRTRLQGLLQTTTETRNATGRSGRLDTRSLHRLAVSDPRVFRKNTHRQGIDTAVHVLLDCSGSMVRNIHLACTACYAVAKALQTMSINVAVTAFPADQLPNGSYVTVAPILRHGQRLHTNFALSAAGGTPMGEALWWTLQDMLALSEHRRIILIVTDGSPDNLDCSLQAIGVARATGFEIYGIGIGSDCIASLLPQKSRTIQKLSELSPAMFGLLQHALINT